VIKPEEVKPRILIGGCLVELNEFTCPASILNTTENEIEIQAPQVIIEEVTREITTESAINNIKEKHESTTAISRNERIKNLLRIYHLNEEKKLYYISAKTLVTFLI
jgi:hypothetical protein